MIKYLHIISGKYNDFVNNTDNFLANGTLLDGILYCGKVCWIDNGERRTLCAIEKAQAGVR